MACGSNRVGGRKQEGGGGDTCRTRPPAGAGKPVPTPINNRIYGHCPKGAPHAGVGDLVSGYVIAFVLMCAPCGCG